MAISVLSQNLAFLTAAHHTSSGNYGHVAADRHFSVKISHSSQ